NNCNYQYQLLMGDININILDETTDYVQYYLNTMNELGFNSHINAYTRVDKNSQTCIDHIFPKSKKKNDDIHSTVLEVHLTDHYTIVARLPAAKVGTVVKKLSKEVRDYEGLKTYFISLDWDSM
ncbi:hypothetical protein HHI36_002078, partial [Cryptolaemus montrouzieri]